MSEREPITTELREAVEWEPTFCGPDRAMVPQPEFDRMCDAIDAIHAGLECENAELHQRVAELDESADYMHDGWVCLPVDGEAPCKQLGEWIEKRGLITGPLDHDGELWHRGDMSASTWGEIEGIVYENGKWFIRGHDTSAPWIPADSIRHYHEPTVEDVLREFAEEMNENLGMYTGEAIDADEWRDADAKTVEKFAAKLRLAGDDE